MLHSVHLHYRFTVDQHHFVPGQEVACGPVSHPIFYFKSISKHWLNRTTALWFYSFHVPNFPEHIVLSKFNWWRLVSVWQIYANLLDLKTNSRMHTPPFSNYTETQLSIRVLTNCFPPSTHMHTNPLNPNLICCQQVKLSSDWALDSGSARKNICYFFSNSDDRPAELFSLTYDQTTVCTD